MKITLIIALLTFPLQVLAMESNTCNALKAITDQNVTMCKALLERGLDPNSPLIIERYADNPPWSFANMLWFNSDGNFSLIDNQEKYTTPLLLRPKSRLLRFGGERTTLLHQAVHCPQIIELLLAAGAQVDATNSFGQTALELAIMDLEPRTVELLLQHGANPKRKLAGSGNLLQQATLFIGCKLAQETSGFSHEEIIQHVCAIIRLLKPTVLEMVKRDILGGTPLHHAAKEYEILCCLLMPQEPQRLHPELLLATAKKIYTPDEYTIICNTLTSPDSSNKRPIDYAKDINTKIILNPLHWQDKNAE